MILKVIQSLISGSAKQEGAGGSLQSGKLVDIAHEAMRRDAESLDGLIKLGQPVVDRKKLKDRIRKKVKGSIAKEFDDEDVVDEVTERIADAAEFDPNFGKMFDD
ncbi:MAG: hypothetical protein HYY43_06075 [Deltaproteobacteria bacterium]|nr:hypothetical protein [Deltaproteobacteria bacterium]MBI2975137.1 hypothetical protein [Deltaproteobacteria bacterium]